MCAYLGTKTTTTLLLVKVLVITADYPASCGRAAADYIPVKMNIWFGSCLALF